MPFTSKLEKENLDPAVGEQPSYGELDEDAGKVRNEELPTKRRRNSPPESSPASDNGSDVMNARKRPKYDDLDLEGKPQRTFDDCIRSPLRASSMRQLGSVLPSVSPKELKPTASTSSNIFCNETLAIANDGHNHNPTMFNTPDDSRNPSPDPERGSSQSDDSVNLDQYFCKEEVVDEDKGTYTVLSFLVKPVSHVSKLVPTPTSDYDHYKHPSYNEFIFNDAPKLFRRESGYVSLNQHADYGLDNLEWFRRQFNRVYTFNSEVVESIRMVLVNYLMEVSWELCLQRKTCQKAINYLDRFYERIDTVPNELHQYIALSALLLAGKSEEVIDPSPKDIAEYAPGNFTLAQCFAIERKIAEVLEWETEFITYFDWIGMYLRRAAIHKHFQHVYTPDPEKSIEFAIDVKQFTLISKIIDIWIHTNFSLKYLPHISVAAAFSLAHERKFGKLLTKLEIKEITDVDGELTEECMDIMREVVLCKIDCIEEFYPDEPKVIPRKSMHQRGSCYYSESSSKLEDPNNKFVCYYQPMYPEIDQKLKEIKEL